MVEEKWLRKTIRKYNRLKSQVIKLEKRLNGCGLENKTCDGELLTFERHRLGLQKTIDSYCLLLGKKTSGVK